MHKIETLLLRLVKEKFIRDAELYKPFLHIKIRP